ncbi:hypothetical protein ACC870_38920, partial [Rhizobium ruizarguesonis]
GALELRPHGSLPRFEILDPLTVRYTWEKPNPMFLPTLVGLHQLVHLRLVGLEFLVEMLEIMARAEDDERLRACQCR